MKSRSLSLHSEIWWIFGVEINRHEAAAAKAPLSYAGGIVLTASFCAIQVFHWILGGVTARIQSSAPASFICFGFLMLLPWLWILSFHPPARQQDCQTPKSMRIRKDKRKSSPAYKITGSTYLRKEVVLKGKKKKINPYFLPVIIASYFPQAAYERISMPGKNCAKTVLLYLSEWHSFL